MRRNQPYLKLFVQDLLTDEKLIECSAAAHGVYLRLLCILHKQELYGKICLKQKHKQNSCKYKNFASMLCKQMPFDAKIIEECIKELHEENVIQLSGDYLEQKRMIKDANISSIRSKSSKQPSARASIHHGKKGILYFMSDTFEKHKIGITTNLKSRVYRLRSDFKLSKMFNAIDYFEVDDMGKAEDFAKDFFKENRDGEWLIGSYELLKKKFVLLRTNLLGNLQSKTEAKTEANSEYEYEYENKTNNTLLHLESKIPQNLDRSHKQEDQKKNKGENLNEKKILNLVEKISSSLSLNQISNARAHIQITEFTEHFANQNRLDWLEKQWQAYVSYKQHYDQPFPQPYRIFGLQNMDYSDGLFAQKDWVDAVSKIKPKGSNASTDDPKAMSKAYWDNLSPENKKILLAEKERIENAKKNQ